MRVVLLSLFGITAAAATLWMVVYGIVSRHCWRERQTQAAYGLFGIAVVAAYALLAWELDPGSSTPLLTRRVFTAADIVVLVAIIVVGLIMATCWAGDTSPRQAPAVEMSAGELRAKAEAEALRELIRRADADRATLANQKHVIWQLSRALAALSEPQAAKRLSPC